MKNKKSFTPEIHPLETTFRNVRQADFQLYEDDYRHQEQMFFTPETALEEKAHAVAENDY